MAKFHHNTTVSVMNNSSQKPHMSTKENMVWNWSPYPYMDSGFRLLPKFSRGTSLSKDTFVIKFSSKSDHSVRRYEPHCIKMPYLAVLKNPAKIPGSGGR